MQAGALGVGPLGAGPGRALGCQRQCIVFLFADVQLFLFLVAQLPEGGVIVSVLELDSISALVGLW